MLRIREEVMEAPAWVGVFQGVAWTTFDLVLVPLLPWSAFCRHLVWVYAQARAMVHRLRRSWLYSFLEIAAMLSVPVVAVIWILEADDRIKARHYRAWELINSARGSSGDGGRKDALRDLKEDGVWLSYAPLNKAYLSKIDLRNAHLWGAQLEEADLSGAKLDDAVLIQANLKNALLYKAELRGSKLMQAELQGKKTNMRQAKLHGADLRGAKMHYADLRGAELNDADLRGAEFQGASLQGANFSGALTAGAHFEDAVLSEWGGFLVTGSSMQYLDQVDAIINEEQIGAAFGNEKTVLPLNFTYPSHWLKSDASPTTPPPSQPPQPESRPDLSH
jgi:uncharacterized protein YjbI with pentapeptide repeats